MLCFTCMYDPKQAWIASSSLILKGLTCLRLLHHILRFTCMYDPKICN